MDNVKRSAKHLSHPSTSRNVLSHQRNINKNDGVSYHASTSRMPQNANTNNGGPSTVVSATATSSSRLESHSTSLSESKATKATKSTSDIGAVGEVLDEITNPPAHTHTIQELYNWTFTHAAVAPCFVNDIFELEPVGGFDDFYWLSRVPCRVVKTVGIVVGIDQFEDMTRYKIDDGTGVIDCDCKCPRRPVTPSKAKYDKPISKRSDAAIGQRPTSPTKARRTPSPQPRTPSADLGDSVCVQGRVVCGRGSRFLRVNPENFTICQSANEEPQHWLNVLRLHQEWYSLQEPFIIPTIPAQPIIKSSSMPPSSPVTASSPSRTTSSPIRPPASAPHHPRLRHPSRLHTRDLTDVTFRIYLKHYMDFAPPYRLLRAEQHDSSSVIDSEDDVDELPQSQRKRMRSVTPTPQGRSRGDALLVTNTPKSREQVSNAEEDREELYGFTLSYLRRVPVLAEMARGVVRAERKRRDREARKRKENPDPPHQSNVAKTKLPTKSIISTGTGNGAKAVARVDTESTSRKMKRLFKKTIRDLYAEGSIILWDGPVRHWSYASNDADDGDDRESGRTCLWKMGTSSSAGNRSVASTLTRPSQSLRRSQSQIQSHSQNDSAEELSEPESGEEAYLTVTTRMVARLVLATLRRVTGSERDPARPKPHSHLLPEPEMQRKPAREGRPCALSLAENTRASRVVNEKRHRPPTMEELTTSLRARDARWANLGIWVVEEALEMLRQEESVYKAGDGRWALCV